MRSLILALAILCGAATCEAADSFYFSNGSFSFSIGPQPRYYRPPVYSPYQPYGWYTNPYQYRSPYYAPPSKYPPRHYPHPYNPPRHDHDRHDHGRRPHRGCH